MIKRNTRAYIDEQKEESRTITGKAISFGTPSRYLGYIEYINSSAITQELIDNSNITFNINHNDDYMMARWNKGQGTLKIELREDGVYFSFDAPPTDKGDELLWNIRNGNIYECSFAFTLSDDEHAMRWFRNEDNELCGEVLSIDGLYDLSAVTTAAYPDTDINANCFDLDAIKRSLDEGVREIIEEEVNDPNEEQVEQREVENSHNDKISIFNSIEEKRKKILNHI